MTRDLLDEIKDRWSLGSSLPRPVPWGLDDVVWLVGEVERLRAEAKRADEEATTLANSDLATTEQVVRALRAENAALREACTLALRVMEQPNKVAVPPYVKTVTVSFDPDDIAVLRAALEKKPKEKPCLPASGDTDLIKEILDEHGPLFEALAKR